MKKHIINHEELFELADILRNAVAPPNMTRKQKLTYLKFFQKIDRAHEVSIVTDEEG